MYTYIWCILLAFTTFLTQTWNKKGAVYIWYTLPVVITFLARILSKELPSTMVWATSGFMDDTSGKTERERECVCVCVCVCVRNNSAQHR